MQNVPSKRSIRWDIHGKMIVRPLFAIFCAAAVYAGLRDGGFWSSRDPYGKLAFEAVEKLARDGNPEAQCELGWRYWGRAFKGEKLDETDTENLGESVRWYRMAAEQGHARAQRLLADAYWFGNGVLKDEAEAVNWYRKAADQGNAFAESQMATAYWGGDGGLPLDKPEAARWMAKAASHGDSLAKEYLPKLLTEIQTDKKDAHDAEAEARRKAEVERRRREAIEAVKAGSLENNPKEKERPPGS